MKEEGETEWDVCRRKGNKQKEGSYQSVSFKESEESLRRQRSNKKKQSKKSLKRKQRQEGDRKKKMNRRNRELK